MYNCLRLLFDEQRHQRRRWNIYGSIRVLLGYFKSKMNTKTFPFSFDQQKISTEMAKSY